MRSPRIFASICFLLLFFTLATARITKAACSGNDCLQFAGNSTGGRTLCFRPDETRTHGVANARCTNPGLDGIVSTHADGVQRGEIPSIAYWNTLTKQPLGGVDWSVHEWQPGLEAGVISMCVTGQRRDGQFETICYITIGDDDFAVPAQQRNVRLICGAIHPTTNSMHLNGCSKMGRSYFPSQSQSRALVGRQWYAQHLAAWTPSVHREEVDIRPANPVKAYQLNHTKRQAAVSGAGHEVSGHEAPRRVRR